MKLLFDVSATQPNSSGKRHGGGRYGEIILFRMIERKLKFACFYDSSKWLNPKVKTACQKGKIPLHDVCGSSVKQIVSEYGYTRLYSCLPQELAELTCCEVYGTVHGLRVFETPYDTIFYHYHHSLKEWGKFTIKKLLNSWFRHRKHGEYLRRYIQSSFRLITVSEHSRYSILSFFPEMKDEKIRVFYSPNTSCGEKKERNPAIFRYFLAVSGNRWEKNNLRAVMAFDRLVTDGRLPQDVKMIVTGIRDNIFKYRVKNPDRFVFLGYVDDDVLEQLYTDAYLFVYPSLNEGFGYPPIEAMRYGVPVIASPLSSMAEICGAGALYFDPFSVEEIMNRMLMMMQPEIYQEYSCKGQEQYKRVLEKQQKDLDELIDYITNFNDYE